MSDTNRRKFLAIAGGGAAAGTVAAAGLASPATAATSRTPGSAKEAVVAYVGDHTSGELRLMVGEREVVVQDRDLVTRILNAAGGN